MEILDNGRLIVDGGNGIGSGNGGGEGGGAGGIIQIISPVGKLIADSLSLRRGIRRSGGSCIQQGNEAHGYYCLQGMSIQWSLMRLNNFLVSSRAVPSISQPGYFHTHIKDDKVTRLYTDLARPKSGGPNSYNKLKILYLCIH